jgi:hypothetical protein
LSIQNHSVAGGSKEKGLSFDLQHAHDPSEVRPRAHYILIHLLIHSSMRLL